MEGFETKKALLEYLGKHPKDNKLVDRMIMRGEVYMEDGMYYIAERVEPIKSNIHLAPDVELERYRETRVRDKEMEKLKERVEELEEENKKLKEKSEEKSDFNPSELEEARVQWKYYEDLAESRRVLMEKVIHETYVIAKSKLGNKMEEEGEFKIEILNRAKGRKD